MVIAFYLLKQNYTNITLNYIVYSLYITLKTILEMPRLKYRLTRTRITDFV